MKPGLTIPRVKAVAERAISATKIGLKLADAFSLEATALRQNLRYFEDALEAIIEMEEAVNERYNARNPGSRTTKDAR